MKLKRGFTLVELLAVFLIIGLIGGLATKFILDASNGAKKRSYEEFENIIKSGTYLYIMNNNSLLNDIKSSECETSKIIKFSSLVKKKYLSSEDLVNPSNGKAVDIENSYVKVYYGKDEFLKGGICPTDNSSNNQDYDYRYYINIVDKE